MKFPSDSCQNQNQNEDLKTSGLVFPIIFSPDECHFSFLFSFELFVVKNLPQIHGNESSVFILSSGQ